MYYVLFILFLLRNAKLSPIISLMLLKALSKLLSSRFSFDAFIWTMRRHARARYGHSDAELTE